MPKISTYNTVIPQGTDKIIISQENGTPANVTKNITVNGLKSYIALENGIPTPYMYVLKRPNIPVPGNRTLVAMQKPFQNEWLNKNPRLFMFRYKKNRVRNNSIMKRANFVHPTHNNGIYQQQNFPGSNWASTPQTDSEDNQFLPITTEWDINTELKIAKTGSLITDFASLRPTTYIEVPFNPLGFLYDSTNTEVTSLPATTTDSRWGTRLTVNSAWSNVVPNSTVDLKTSIIIMKFAIGIPNANWTNTNHELPYIFGNLSNALTLRYQYAGSNSSIVNNYTITQGSRSISSKQAF